MRLRPGIVPNVRVAATGAVGALILIIPVPPGLGAPTGARHHQATAIQPPASVPGKYDDGRLAPITRSKTFKKERRGGTPGRETLAAPGGDGEGYLPPPFVQGRGPGILSAPDPPKHPLRAARNPEIMRWYQEDQVMNVVRSDPLNINRVSEITLEVKGELEDVFDGNQRVVAVVIQRPYMRQVYVP